MLVLATKVVPLPGGGSYRRHPDPCMHTFSVGQALIHHPHHHIHPCQVLGSSHGSRSPGHPDTIGGEVVGPVDQLEHPVLLQKLRLRNL